MEQRIKLKTKDKHTIYGTLNWQEPKPNILLIIVHGLTGHQHEHIHYNAARFFPKEKIATFRFNLYGEQDDARKLQDCTLKIHGEDITTVINYCKRTFSSLFLAGHSLGGPSILFADLTPVKGIIFWDGANPNLYEDRSVFVYNKKIDAYIIHWNIDIIMGKKMVEERKQLRPYTELISEVKIPAKFITAEKGELLDVARTYYQYANGPKELVVIKNATHCFDEEGTEKELFRETLEFIVKNSKE